MPHIQIGLKGQEEMVVEHQDLASVMGNIGAEAQVTKIEGRRLVFEVAAFDEFEKIAEGENEQLIVSIDKFLARIKKKTIE